MYNPYELSFAPDEVIVYLRKSRSDDPTLTVEEVLSKHEAILDEWSEKHLGALVPEENKYREVVSGETIADRPKIKEVLRRIESPKIKAILVVEVQRISRGDLEDAGRLMKLLRYTNTMVITPPKTYNLQDEYDRDFFERELKRGNEFLEYQKKIMNRGRLLAVQQGYFIAAHTPYGYDRAIIMDGKRKCHTLKINEAEANIVRMIFDLYVNQNMGLINIAHRLDELGVRPPRGEHWSPATLKELLANEHYLGKVRWNRRKTVNTVEKGQIIKSKPKNEPGDYLLFDGKHEAIISEELFYAARAKQGRNPRTKAKNKIRNPLAGLLYCQCGTAMVLRYHSKDHSRSAAVRLHCNNQVHCNTASCSYDEMIELISTYLKECINDFEIRARSNNEDTIRYHNNLIRQLQTRFAELERKEIAQWEKYSEEAMPKHIFDSLNAKVLNEKDDVQRALIRAQASKPDSVDYQEKILLFQNALDSLSDPNVSAERKNALLKACIDRIDYYRDPSVRVTKEMSREIGHSTPGANWISSPIHIDVKLRLDSSPAYGQHGWVDPPIPMATGL